MGRGKPAITIDGQKLKEKVQASKFTALQIEQITGRGNGYISKACGTNRISPESLNQICILLGDVTPDDFDPAKEEPKQTVISGDGKIEERLLALEGKLTEAIDALERIANYTSQTNAKIYRICEELLK